MARSNRRIQQTKQKLNKALTELIKEKDYEQILVQDITQRADLSRATFYLHYHDKEELFNEGLERLVDAIIGRFQAAETLVLSAEPLRHIFQLVADNHRLYRTLLADQGSSLIGSQLRSKLAIGLETWLRALGTQLDENMAVSRNLIYGYTANALLGMIAWWLDNDMPHSADYMAHISRQLLLFGSFPLMMGGLPNS